MNIKYLGHSAFEIETKNNKILIDPFLVCANSYYPENITDIFVTHAHGDHLGSAIDISKKNNARITAIFELANYCAKKGAFTNDISFGSWIKYKWGDAIAVPAFHSSSSNDGIYCGEPCGFVFRIEDNIIYHAGDTNLSSEIKTIGELYAPNISILPIGGKYTMDIEHACIAAKWLKSKNIIPMHYNTFDAIKVDINEFETKIRQNGQNPVIMNIG